MLIKSSVDNHFKIAKTNLTDLIHYVKFKRVKKRVILEWDLNRKLEF